ncbi:MAG: glycine/D-amino acid oxidase-like deaminating enzyme [Gammaproteobacteria bacterium]|jgi:glycine/D-amino acid oxidase-like deaminating enzyme
MDKDYLVVGGGLVGAALAYGLALRRNKVQVLDEGDRAFRASRGNFGLVWVQGKGWDCPAYAKWSNFGADLWPALAQQLQANSGVDIDYQRPGGVEFCLNEAEWAARSNEMAQVQQHVGDAFEYEMLDHSALKKIIPQIGKDVIGGSYSPQDGHVNPLYLLRALHQQMQALAVDYHPNKKVESIEHRDNGFLLQTKTGSYSAAKVVICAGLDTQRLAAMLGMQVPVRAIRGQILITEKIAPFLHYPTLQVRQTAEGGVQIGDSHEDVGRDDGTSIEIMASIAARAIRMFPLLEQVQLLRAWGALRVMTPDGIPVYQQSVQCPGAFAIATHSGVSLAAAHAGPVVEWITGADETPLITNFDASRFAVTESNKPPKPT